MHTHALKSLNLYMHRAFNPLPILNDPKIVIEALKNYFNDPHIFVSHPTEQEQNVCSLFHNPALMNKVQETHKEWIEANPNSSNQKDCFISFFTYLCESMPEISVSYCEEKNQLESTLKQSYKKSAKNSILNKRLRQIFECFSSMNPQQNTFEQFNEISSHLNLIEWLQVFKSFRLYGNKQLDTKESRRLKKIFEYFSNKQKRLTFSGFIEALKVVFCERNDKQKQNSLEEGYDVMGIWKKQLFEENLRPSGVKIPKQKYSLKNLDVKKPQMIKQGRKNRSANTLFLKPLSDKHVAIRNQNEKTNKKKKNDLQNLGKESKDDFIEQYENKQFAVGVLKRIDERITRVIGKK